MSPDEAFEGKCKYELNIRKINIHWYSTRDIYQYRTSYTLQLHNNPPTESSFMNDSTSYKLGNLCEFHHLPFMVTVGLSIEFL